MPNKRCLLPINHDALGTYLAFCKDYAETHDGCTAREKECDVVDAEGKCVIFPLYAGSKYSNIILPEECSFPWLMENPSMASVHVTSKERFMKILLNRSGIDLTVRKQGRVYLHDGLIEVQLDEENPNTNIGIMWYGGAEVTKHVAALLGIIKDLT